MDYERIDINQCPLGEGNPGPNKFADTARCKKETTECEPIHGWGLRRGGYQCRCKPGFRLPSHVRRPFLGEIVERASAEQYYNGFDCAKIGCMYLSLLTIFYSFILAFLNQHVFFLNIFRGPESSDSMGTCTLPHSRKIFGRTQ